MVTLQLTATLKDINGNPLAGKALDFYYSYDGATWSLIESKTTDSSGKASTTFSTTTKTYFKAEFKGDDEYEPSSALKLLTLVEGATVEIYSNGKLIATLTTDSKGEASITLVVGSYTVKVSKEGFETHEQTVNLTANKLKEVVLQKAG